MNSKSHSQKKFEMVLMDDWIWMKCEVGDAGLGGT
jgi:hypothetical protein